MIVVKILPLCLLGSRVKFLLCIKHEGEATEVSSVLSLSQSGYIEFFRYVENACGVFEGKEFSGYLQKTPYCEFDNDMSELCWFLDNWGV